MAYRSEIDGLRAVAVASVVLFHAGFTAFGGGYVGVDVFFVISGYLITTLILLETQAGTFSLAGFYARRARRILPALFLVVLCCVPFAWRWMLPEPFRDFAQSVAAVSVFSSNALFWIERSYFDTAAEVKPLLHTWTLAVEEQYYVLFPILILVTWRFGARVVTATIVTLAVCSLLLAEWGWRHAQDANFFLLPARGWELLAGALAALYLNARGTPRTRWNQLAGMAGLALVVSSVFVYDGSTPFPSQYTLAPVLGAVLIVVFATRGTLTHRALSTPLLVHVGLISYSVYLWHQPLFAFARLRAVTEPGPMLLGGLAAASLGLGWLSWRLVERPFRDPARVPRRRLFALAAAASAALFVLGAGGHMAAGFAGRLTPEQASLLERREQLGAARQDATLSGTCHFNGRGPQPDIAGFIAAWNCHGSAGARFAVVGDSHAADIAIGLRQHGVDVLQIGGAGCSLTPSRMSTLSYCRPLFDFARDEVRRAGHVEVLLLVNRFDDEAELEGGAVREALEYWGATGKPIVLFSPRPEIYGFDRALLTGADRRLDVSRLFHVDELAIDPGVLAAHDATLADSRALFCAMSERCGYRDADGDLLMVDGHHLTIAGAGRFVEPFLAAWP